MGSNAIGLTYTFLNGRTGPLGFCRIFKLDEYK